MDSISEDLKSKGFECVKLNKKKSPLILFMTLDREDNNMFMSKISNAVKNLSDLGKRITIKNMMKATGYSKKEIELNLFEIKNVMDSLGVE